MLFHNLASTTYYNYFQSLPVRRLAYTNDAPSNNREIPRLNPVNAVKL